MKPTHHPLALALLIASCGGGSSATPRPEGIPAEPIAADCPECPEVPLPDPDESELAPVVSVERGRCDLDWLPPALVDEVGESHAASLVDNVRSWLARAGYLQLEPARGIVFAKSPDDSGADDPPTWSDAYDTTACGVQALWLRSWLRDYVRYHADPEDGGWVRCDGNVCCFPALGEYDSGGTLIFELDDDGYWFLEAAAIVANNGTLADDYIEELELSVAAALAAAAGHCPGEPEDDW